MNIKSVFDPKQKEAARNGRPSKNETTYLYFLFACLIQQCEIFLIKF